MEYKDRIREDSIMEEKEYEVPCVICHKLSKVRTKVPPSFAFCDDCKSNQEKFWEMSSNNK